MTKAPRQPIEIAAVVSVLACASLAMALALAGCDAGAGSVGAQGAAGAAGVTGAAGAQGAAGVTGVAGGGAAGSGKAGAPAAAGPDAGSDGRPDAAARDAGGAERAAEAGGSEGGAAGAGAAVEPSCQWPTATGEQKVGATIGVAKLFDGGMKRFIGDGPLGSSGQVEGQPPLFQLANGSTLQNVILGNPAADGVHCAGTCTLTNVWWEDVGEDAATSTGSSATQVMTIDGGGARHATDKVFQHNGAGTMVIQGFCAQDFGKLYRSCGNCKTQYPRHVVIRNVSISSPAGSLAGVNENYGDSATFSGVFLRGANPAICQRYTGNNTGAEPVQTGSGADGKFCVYKKSDVVTP